MGKNNRLRRAVKQRARHQRGPTPARSRDGSGAALGGVSAGANPFLRTTEKSGQGSDDVLGSRRAHAQSALTRLIGQATASGRSAELMWATDRLIMQPGLAGEADELLTLYAMASLAAAWERGWQPADVLHQVRRVDARAVPVAAALIAEQARRTAAADRAPEGWLRQLRVAQDEASAGGMAWSGPEQGWLAVEVQCRAGAVPTEAWVSALVAVGAFGGLLPLERLVDPPSEWSTGQRRQAATSTQSDWDKVMSRIRALLAKAEATTYAAEAEAFTAKAQDLMSRHAIDEALLRAHSARSIEVRGIRIHLASPYVGEKVALLNVVASASRAKTVYLQQAAMATVLGTPVDLDQIEMLFTSLLIQATRAMAEAGAAHSGSFDRSASFRRSFLMSYAMRIGERLNEADVEAVRSYGAELVPVLRDQAEAVDAEVARLFPRLREKRSSSYDLRGWEAGRAAADRATFAAGRLPHTGHG